MTIRTVRLPDVGEGIAEAELVSWFVRVGDAVTADTVIAEVLTDKATVEIYAPVAGTVIFVHGEPGDVLAIGSDFVGIDVSGVSSESTDTTGDVGAHDRADPSRTTMPEAPAMESSTADVGETGGPRAKVTAAPAVRKRANSLGIDLGEVDPSSADGRITHEDLDRHIVSRPGATIRRVTTGPSDHATSHVPVLGLRRRIASKMTTSWRIPHITYVEEIDVTQLEHLRSSLASEHPDRSRLTMLPFVMRAIVLAVAAQPHLNATFDDEAQPQVLTMYAGVHIGIATQTPNGLIVPVVHDAQELDLWRAGAELTRVTTAARDGSMTRQESTGSTITITSLGALGGLVTTPIINHPEVAIVGINKMQTRPIWDAGTFVPRKMMNMSSSFDHRVVDGFDAATFIQRIKTLLEEPALLIGAIPDWSRPAG